LDKSKLIIGTAQFGLNYGINNIIGKTREKDVFSILDYAFENGIHQIDTASAYGDAEEIIGRYFKESKSEKWKVTTKFSFVNEKNMTDSLEDSLHKLSVNVIDTVLFHSYNDYNIYKDQLSEFNEKNKNKHYNFLGVSVYTNEEIEKILDDNNIDVVQAPYNLLDNSTRRGNVFSKLKRKNKKIQVRSVFLQGLFFMKSDQRPINLYHLKQPLEKLIELCKRYSLSMHQLALIYVLQNSLIDGALIGVDSHEQLVKNFEGTMGAIPELLIKEIESINVSDERLLNPSQWRI
jgi:aryl-alcohol dehydrogenase-like predicted oxidoreductase